MWSHYSWSDHDSKWILLSWPRLFIVFLLCFLPSGKPLGDRPVRLPGQVLHATLQEWEFTELHNERQTTGQPLYCQGVFDAITMGEVQIKYCYRIRNIQTHCSWLWLQKAWKQDSLLFLQDFIYHINIVLNWWTKLYWNDLNKPGKRTGFHQTIHFLPQFI